MNFEPEIIKFSLNQSELAALARDIRFHVFVLEQQVPENLEFDEFEKESHHYLVQIEGKAVAACRWRHTPAGIKLERFAVLNKYRGKGLGAIMVRHLLDEVKPLDKEIYIHAQVQVVDFYQKYGFVIDSPEFVEAGIPHHKMVFVRDIPG